MIILINLTEIMKSERKGFMAKIIIIKTNIIKKLIIEINF